MMKSTTMQSDIFNNSNAVNNNFKKDPVPSCIPQLNYIAPEKLIYQHQVPTTSEMQVDLELQPTINLGTLGHVAHGKSTIVHSISGKSTIKHSKEQEKSNMTIKLGYANAKIYQCPTCPKPQCYQVIKPSSNQQRKRNKQSTAASSKPIPTCTKEGCNSPLKLIRHVSFVDCPGHDALMATMLNGTAVMDGALLVISSADSIPQAQTAEHVAAADIMGLSRMIIVQNKIDLIKREDAMTNHQKIREFVTGTVAQDSPIIPVSAQLGINIDVVLQQIVETIPLPKHDLLSPPRMYGIRSFDINHPGTETEQLKGAVIGGSLQQGILKIGQVLELRPGKVVRAADGSLSCTPLITPVLSLSSEETALEKATPGGLIGIGTTLDPSLGKDDGLVGQVLGLIGTLPDVYQEIEVKYRLMRRVVGTKDNVKIPRMKKGEKVLVSVGSLTANGEIVSVAANQHEAKIRLGTAVCAEVGQKFALSKKVEPHGWRLVGWGQITPQSVPIPCTLP